jgi:phosphoketolase
MHGNRGEREKAGMIVEKTAQTTIRMTEAEREAWECAARLDWRTLSAWIVRRCNGEPTAVPMLSALREVRKLRPKRKAR